MDTNIPSPSDTAETVLRFVGRRYANGQELTVADRLIAITATAAQDSTKFGPGPAELRLDPPDLPEAVKGALVKQAT